MAINNSIDLSRDYGGKYLPLSLHAWTKEDTVIFVYRLIDKNLIISSAAIEKLITGMYILKLYNANNISLVTEKS